MKKRKIFKLISPALISILFLTFLLLLGVSFNNAGAQQILQISPERCSIYISAAQRASKPNATVDWRTLIAIDAVRLDQRFDTVTIEEAEELAKQFIIETKNNGDTSYKLKSLDQVLDELHLSQDEKEQVYMFIEAAKDILSGPEVSGEKMPADNAEFVNRVVPGAIDCYRKYKVLPSITIAQAILESAWGRSGLTVKGNNLFGVKAFGWSGSVVEMNTTEYDNAGNAYTTVAGFRGYSSWNDSIEDHAKILLQPNFRGVIAASNYIEAAQQLLVGGYATDPQYPSLIIGLIEQYGLQKYDDPNYTPSTTPTTVSSTN